MSRYIDADKLGIGRADPKIFNNPEYANGWNSAIEIIEKAPTADVKEVKHGQWIKDRKFNDGLTRCSTCHILSDRQPNYCPYCGARMDGGVKE